MSSPARASARTIASLCATSFSSRSSWRRRARQPRRRRATALPRRQSPAGGQLGRVHGRPSMRWPVAAAKLCSATIGVIGRSDRGRVLLSRSGNRYRSVGRRQRGPCAPIPITWLERRARPHSWRRRSEEWRRQPSEIRPQREAARGRRRLRLQAAALLAAGPFLAAGQAHQNVDRHCRLARRSGVIDASDSRGYPAATPRVPSLPVDQAGASRARRPSAPRVP